MTEQEPHGQDFSITRKGEGTALNGIVRYEVVHGEERTTAYLPDLPDETVAQHAKEIFDAQAFAARNDLKLSPTPTKQTVIEDGQRVDIFSRIQPLLLQQALRRAFQSE